MPSIEIIATKEKVWETDGFPLCLIDISVAKLAENLEVPLEHWDEDGLGNASGFMVRLPSGILVLVEEFVHAVRYLGQKGPSIHVDASQFVDKGPSVLIDELMKAFRLSPNNFTWVQSEDAVDSARKICETASVWKKQRPIVR